jgi:hypothetical protein
MPAKCFSCGKTSRGNMPTAKINGEERTYCADCLWKLDKEYKQKKNCDECAHFSQDKCKKTNKTLVAEAIGYAAYFPQAETCRSFTTDNQVVLEEIRKLELAARYDEVAAEYERLGMHDEAEEARKKVVPIDINAEIKTLSKNGQTVTYFCCYCGAKLQIGKDQPQVQKACPKCSGDLEVINLGKLINKRLSKS